MLIHRIPNPSATNEVRARKLFESLRREFQARKVNSHGEVKQALMERFAAFFENAGKSHYSYESINPDDIRLASLYNKIQETIADDFEVAYEETKALLNAAIATFNYQQVHVRGLTSSLAKAVSALQDLEIVTDYSIEAAFAAGDDFSDSSRIDLGADLSNPLAELPAYQDAVVLKRTSAVNLLENNPDIKINVVPSGGLIKLYEGRMFALAGKAEPEAGEFRWKRATGLDRISKLDPNLLDRYKQYVSSSLGSALTPKEGLDKAKRDADREYAGFTWEEWESLASAIATIGEIFTLPPARSKTFKTADKNVYMYDEGATPEELMGNRLSMTDGDPNTYWQAEYVADLQSEMIPWQDNDDHKVSVTIDEDMLRSAEKSADQKLGLDLGITVVVDMAEIRQINWLSLLPHLFDSGHLLKVRSIETSENGEDWAKLEGWDEHKYENLLTPDVNQELSEEEADVTLAPGKFDYKGTGLWTFPPRNARFIRFALKQEVPQIAPYNKIVLIMKKRVTHTSRQSTWFGRGKKRTRPDEELYEVPLSYPESALILGGTASVRELMEEETTVVSNFIYHVTKGVGIGTRRKTIEEHEIIDELTRTYWDKARYAIGIREIGAHSHTYEQASEIVSHSYEFPRPIKKIHLRADRIIPKDFPEGDWIEYYIGFGDSGDWHRIRPIDATGTHEVPKILNVNSETEEADRLPSEGYIDLEKPVKKVRCRFVLRRPAGMDTGTPVLKGYRFIAFVK